MLIFWTLLACCIPGPTDPKPDDAAASQSPASRSAPAVISYETRVLPAEGDFQQEIVRFATVASPKGLELGQGDVEVPRRLVGEGVASVDVVMKSGEAAAVRVGGLPFSITSGSGIRLLLDAPTIGRIELVGGSGRVERVDVRYWLPDSRYPYDYYRPQATLAASRQTTLSFPAARVPGLLDSVELVWSGSVVTPITLLQRGLSGNQTLGTVPSRGTTTFRFATPVADASGLSLQADTDGAVLEEAKLYYRDPDPMELGMVVGRAVENGERLVLAVPPALAGRQLGRVELRWADAGAVTRLRVGGTLIGERPPERTPSEDGVWLTRYAWLGDLSAAEIEVELRGAAQLIRMDAGLVVPTGGSPPTR